MRGHERWHIVLGRFWTGNLKEKVTAAQGMEVAFRSEQLRVGSGGDDGE